MVQEEVGMLLGIPGQIENLGETVRDIQCVLADVERKQTKGSAIEQWLMQLKDVIYDADDVIDLCQIKAKECLTGSSSCSNARCGFPLLSCFRNPVFAHEIGSKIKDINVEAKTNKGSKPFDLFPSVLILNRWQMVPFYIGKKSKQVVYALRLLLSAEDSTDGVLFWI